MTQSKTGWGARPSSRAHTPLVQRVFSTPGLHPYDELEWERRDVVQTNYATGEEIFRQEGVEFPKGWSVNASTIATTKYFRGQLGTDRRETSLKQVIDRIVKTYSRQGLAHGYFADEAEAELFEHELAWLLVNQHFAFNSPVWFNIGFEGRKQTVSACFILGVNDSMESVLDWYREEGLIFKAGSGAGVNLSNIRSSVEHLSAGGTASGPVSFMRGADASAGTIKSGGAVRRAAKMVVLDVDHPDVEEFIETKVREEEKIRVLAAAGFDMGLSGRDIISVQYQNANNSVAVDDAFMEAVERDGEYQLRARRSGEPVRSIKARQLLNKVAEAAWACADPGLIYSTTMNDWHTIPAAGPITATNPCGEFCSIDNSSCNLASLNLMRFLSEDDSFDAERFVAAVRLVTLAMDVSICFAEFPTEKITENTRRYRQLGVGYANLGALLMATGRAYDSEEGRELAAAITSLMTAAAHAQSAELAKAMGAYHEWNVHEASHLRVVRKHLTAARDLSVNPIGALALKIWEDAHEEAAEHGLRNSQLSLLAPTGTIGFLMDCDTTGIEPDFSLVKFKKLVGGGSMKIVNGSVLRALARLGYPEDVASAIVAYIHEHGHVVDAPGLDPEHYVVFDCAMGARPIAAMGHLKMMAAVQPFLSGAISKTVNLPHEATAEDIAEIYLEGWRMGLKDISVYRDGCKNDQPLSSGTGEKKPEPAAEAGPRVVERVVEVKVPTRVRLPKQRSSRTTSFTVGGAEGYMTSSEYTDGRIGEVFLKLGKQGSTLSGVMDAFSIALSVALQYGVPLETYISKFTNLKFEPAGMTDDPDVRMSQSVLDYVFRRLAIDYLTFEERAELGVYTTAERARYSETGSYLSEEDEAELAEDDVVTRVPVVLPRADAPVAKAAHSTTELAEAISGEATDAPLCFTCGTKMQRAGSCYVCEGCGSTSGCS